TDSVQDLARDLSGALKAFHRALIEAEAGGDPSLENPYSRLFAVIGDPRFAWTNPLAQLILQLDERMAQGDISTTEDLLPFREKVSRILGEDRTGGGEDASFRLRYLIALQNSPDVALATGGLRRMLARLPKLADD